MNLFEAAAVPAIPAGAVIGALCAKSHGILALIGGSLLGVLTGLLGGLLYAFILIMLLATTATLWSAARGRPEAPPPTESEISSQSRIARPGLFLGVLAGALLARESWIHALIAMLAIVSATALAAVAIPRLTGRADSTP